MRNLIFALIALTSAVASLKGQNSRPSESSAPLTPGKYILIDGNLEKTAITFSKASDGNLALTCPSAPASPSAVFQKGSVFQFSLLYPEPDRFTALRCATYVGRGTTNGGEANYTGSFAYLAAAQNKGVNQSTGKFILYKVGDKP